jgi:N-acetylglucosamine kinase-like BadF-type ATPase
MTHAPLQPPRVLGIDVGGTHTRIALGSANRLDDELNVATTSWRTHALDHNAAQLSRLVRDWLGEPALDLPLAVGAHGCDSTEQCDRFAAALRRDFTAQVVVVNDAELLVPASGRAAGIGVIAGTGSIAVTRDADGRLLTAGGWGWVLGDEGGAAGLVREAVRAVLGRLDRGDPPDPLGRRLLRTFAAADGAQLAMAVTAAPSAAWLGERVIEVFHAAEEGSTLGALVIRQAGEQLADLVDRLVGRGVPSTEVVAGGSVLLSQPRLGEAFLGALGAGHPELSVDLLDRPPVYGALALAAAAPAVSASER